MYKYVYEQLIFSSGRSYLSFLSVITEECRLYRAVSSDVKVKTDDKWLQVFSSEFLYQRVETSPSYKLITEPQFWQ